MAPFKKSEYAQRIRNVKQRMDRQGIDALCVIEPANINWLTGYDGESAYVPQMLVLPANAKEPWFITRKMDVACGVHTMVTSPERILGYPEDLIAHPDKDGFDYVIDRLIDWGFENRTIGVEKGATYFTANAWEKFERRLQKAKFVDVSGLVNWARMLKSPQEITYLREAAAISDLAMQAAIDNIRPGVRECDAAAEVVAALCRGTERFGGGKSMGPAMPSGLKSSAPHLTWTDERYKPGTPITIELGGYRHRYAAGLSRTVHIGKPPTRLKTLHEATLRGMEVVFDNMKPGITCEKVEELFRKETTKRGFLKESRIGYAIGVDWTEGTASLRAGDRTVMAPNMTFHLMLGMWQGHEWGYVLSESFLITEKGYESFAKLPRELFVV